ncbi:MrcB family domain-containing protein [Thioalkalivibrio sp. HK1]|uniref:MrcB family domain-containing protein n=1 Tax=Thioalkalivibrio sp. HK1 TaxID=1469245 RepID=UPI00046EA127|nr:DUF3578 domain-containing protein [Thioalkalivibrio sp. HK1]
MIDVIQRIAKLQTLYSHTNTHEMQERGELIRKDLPGKLKKHLPRFSKSLGEFSNDLRIKGSDGSGNKIQTPWVRIYCESLSPSSMKGFYVVIHFSTDGAACFVTLGCSATTRDKKKRIPVQNPDEELNRRKDWANHILKKYEADRSVFVDTIDLRSEKPLPLSFEKATLLCKRFDIDSIVEADFVDAICAALDCLFIIYRSYSVFGDLPASDIAAKNMERMINPGKAIDRHRQGYGLNGAERKAVELRAMQVTKEYLENEGFEVEDKSNTEPFDYLAIKGELIVKVEVKGTTSTLADCVMMTANEVDLHSKESGTTALAIVTCVIFDRRGDNPQCSGGDLEYIHPWQIDQWTLEPKAYLVKRPLKKNST